MYDINVYPRDLPDPIEITKAENLDIVFDHVLNLTGHTIYRSPDALHMLLDWKAIIDNTKELKTFVHVYNDQGKLVSQADTFPQKWTFNTNIWTKNVVIHDEISLPLSNLDPGSYTISLVLYEISTGNRFPITSTDDGIEYSNDIVILSRFSIE